MSPSFKVLCFGFPLENTRRKTLRFKMYGARVSNFEKFEAPKYSTFVGSI